MDTHYSNVSVIALCALCAFVAWLLLRAEPETQYLAVMPTPDDKTIPFEPRRRVA